ncbi:sirohydrochlorin chelatase [Geminocystis sp. NIES-3709]|uniref:sirohydrochlorin chelatase n=1 Tax=Geminocystis sp. NIES-3709 TaxID=1617448 RepID=UPI0005FC7D9D|nr:sirohydrochlorin chelatase [Geminocystis sp. NIES-3709]BAQ65909.1 sirohydrochlorin cobaltochelatase [Geminocystis sp. NIES-3709]
MQTLPITQISSNYNNIVLKPLPYQRPLLMIGHGTRDEQGRQVFMDFVHTYQELDRSRPVISCFLELTEPNIMQGVEYCIKQGYEEISALPILLFAARHNKFDVTNELDRCRLKYPQLQFYYGRHFGITPSIINLWQNRLAQLDNPEHNSHNISRAETVLLFVGRGSSDPDANGDVYKLARILWEGSGYNTVETCFIGITHPRLEEGFRRALLYQPKRIIVLPYFLFMGALMKKIYAITEEHQNQYPHIDITCLPEMGIQPELLKLIRDREIETHKGEVKMNCEMCKFRLNALANDDHHHHHHDHNHGHHNHHHDSDPLIDPIAYHERIWQTP